MIYNLQTQIEELRGNGYTWFDAAGNPTKQQSPGELLFTKTASDSLDRGIKQYVGYDLSESPCVEVDGSSSSSSTCGDYSTTTNVLGDTIFEQTETASICQERGLKVLVIDTDTQANFTSSFLDPTQNLPGVERLFHPGAEQNPELLVRRTRYPHIDVLPSSAALARFDLADQREWERAELHLSLVDPIRELRPHFDYVLIDCPPRLSLVSFAAFCASDESAWKGRRTWVPLSGELRRDLRQ